VTGEFAVIERLRHRFPAIGDDTAVVEAPSGPLLLAADAVVAGVHADLAVSSLDDVGWRAVVANVSDVAAMGGRPLYLLVTVAAPAATDLELLFDGIEAAADEYGCSVMGGDLTNAGVLSVSVAIVGTVDAPPGPVRRAGARPGDLVWVTGPLGAMAASGYRLRPRARVDEGAEARRGGATAMIDVSDGLAADVGHLADASGVGVALETVPVADGATIEHALHGGEDYELVFTAPPGAAVPGTCIGTCTADPAVRTLGGAPLPPGGWEHAWD
jgi:thiamine-monophosphate kinase